MRATRLVAAVAVLGVVAGCSGDASPTADSGVPATSAPAAAASEAAPVPEADAEADAEAAPAEWSVSVDVTADGFGDEPLDGSASWTGDPASLADADPFGEFAACSGLRAHVGAYSVLVSGGDDVISAVGVWTADPVYASGIYDAEVRIESTDRPVITASGTLTVLPGLQRGEFVATGGQGGRVEGTFSCTGAPSPTPIRTGDPADDVVDTVEVFALLRDGDAERVVALATDGTADASCPASDDPSDQVVVWADGDRDLGSIETFELVDGSPGSARFRVGGETYAFDDATLALADGAAAGAFSAAAPSGVSVDGAFRCT